MGLGTVTEKEVINDRNKKLAKIRGSLFISVKEAAQRNKITISLLHHLLAKDRVNGAYMVADNWIVPFQWKYERQRKGKKKKVIKVNPLALQDPSKIRK